MADNNNHTPFKLTMIIGWSMAPHVATILVSEALLKGVGRRGRAPVVEHSDRGSPYASLDFRARLDPHGPMSRKGNCCDNAIAESLFVAFKCELIYRNRFETRIQSPMAIFDYIELFFNRRKLHSRQGYHRPWEKVQKAALRRSSLPKLC